MARPFSCSALKRRHSAERLSLRRATSAAAAAPNRTIIGGAGTGVPPLEPEEPPLDELELDELELDEELELVLEVLVLPPKLLEPPDEPLLPEEPLEPEEPLLPDEPLLPELPLEPWPGLSG